MGFSSSLQGETAHEALLARQDAELRLLGNPRFKSVLIISKMKEKISYRTVALSSGPKLSDLTGFNRTVTHRFRTADPNAFKPDYLDQGFLWYP
jgi:hypothetical protein